MDFDFDQVVNRQGTDSFKWSNLDADKPPMWVADMYFVPPQSIVDALQSRVAHGIFGYGAESVRLREILVERMARLYQWSILPEDIVFLPDPEVGLNVVARAVGEPGSGVLVNTPVYEPFLTAPINQMRALQVAPLAHTLHTNTLYYTLDMDALAHAMQPHTRLFFLCNPHNPVGRAYTRTELLTISEFCVSRDLVICTDESHCDLLLDGTQHIPVASLSPEIGQRTITLISPNKTFNISGLGASIAIIQNPELRKQVMAARTGIVPESNSNILGMVAAEAAYAHCDSWLQALLAYLTTNRDFAVNYLGQHLPYLHITNPEATYLLWLDCRNAEIAGVLSDFFLQQAHVAVNDGKWFGHAGEGFVQLNFGCPRSILLADLERIKSTLG